MTKILLDIPEVIETKRLQLLMPRAGFGEALHAAILDGYKDYVQWLMWPSEPPTVEKVEADCRHHHAAFILREEIRYLIWDKEKKIIVGRCALPSFQANWTIPQFGLSYFIRGSERSKGYASEAVRALASMAFACLKARKLEIFCDSENIPSQRVALSLGFFHEYSQRGSWPRWDGALCNLHTYSLFGSENLL